MVTPMPFWAEKVGVSRTLAVEFPFAHALGQPHDVAQQMRVIRQALAVLETAETPGTIVHSVEKWPVPQREAQKCWQPAQPSPVIELMAPRVRELVRQQRRARGT